MVEEYIQEAVEVETPPQNPPEKKTAKQKLYETVKQKGLYSKSYDEFNAQFSSPKTIEKLYQVVKQKGLYSKPVDSFKVQFFSGDMTKKQLSIPQEKKPILNFQSAPFKTIETTADQYAQMGSQPLQTRASMAATNIKNAFSDIDEVVKDYIVEEKEKASADQRQNLGIDNTMAPLYIPPELIKKQKEAERAAIPQEQIDEFKNDPRTQRFLVRKKVADFKSKGNEDAAKKLQASTYLLDAEERATPDRVNKIEENASKIESGELIYDPESGQLIKPLSFGNGILQGYRNRTKDYEDAGKLMSMSKEEGLKYLNDRLKDIDPDKPIPMPEMVSGLIGSEGLSTTKSILAAALVSRFGGSPELANTAAAAASADEIYKRSWINEMVRGYDQISRRLKFENPNMPDAEIQSMAYDEADALATKMASSDLASNAVMTYVGAKLGNKPLNFNPSKGVLNSAKKITGATVDFVKKSAPEVVVTGGVAGTSQAIKNQLANDAGAYRDAEEGVLETASIGAALPLVMGALIQAPGIAKKQFAHSFRKTPIEIIVKTATDMAQDGVITPVQAEQAINEIQQYQQQDAQIPETIKGDQRLEAKDLMDEYNANKEKLAKPEEGGLHESVTKPIKERQKEIEWEMNLRQQVPEDQIKLLKSKKEELSAQIKEHDNAKSEGKTGKLEDRAKVKKQLTDIEKRLASTEEKINDPLYKAQKIVEKGEVQGFSKEIIEDAAANDPETFKTYLQNIAEQAQDPNSAQTTIETYGKDLVKIADEMFPQKQPPAVIMPEENISRETITIKPKEDAIQVRSSEKISVDEPSGDRAQMGERISQSEEPAQIQGREENKTSGQEVIPSEPPTAKTNAIYVERPDVEISHKGLQDVANEFGLEDVSTRNAKTDQQLARDAEDTIKSWVDKGEYNYKIEDLISKTENKNHTPTDEERMILQNHLNSLVQEARRMSINTPEYDAKLKGIDRVVRAGERARSEAGASLRLPGTRVSENTREAFMQRNMEETGVTILTEKQKADNAREFEQFEAAKKVYDEKIAQLEADSIRLQAEKELKKKVAKTPKAKVKKDFAKERSDIYASMKEKLRKARGETSVVAVPYAKELIAIAPDVAKLVKNLVEEGVTELAEVVKRIHKDLKEDIPDIQERDIHNIIAGEYAEKKQTRNSLAEQLVNLRMEAKLANQLEELMTNQAKAKTEKAKIKYNSKVESLKSRIKSLEKEIAEAKKNPKENKTPEEQALGAIKTRTRNAIKDIEEKIVARRFAPDEKKAPTPLDREAIELKDKLIKLKIDREVRLIKEKFANETGADKAKRLALELANVPRTVMSSFDLSAPGRQGLVATVSHPVIASKAFVKMLQAAKSEKVFNRWFSDLQESPIYKTMQESKLAINDPLDPRLGAKEEAFMNNLAQKIPIVGRFIKGSERAYVLYLNKLRADIFKQGIEAFVSDGKTMQNSPELYKALASHINNMTGRGDLGYFDGAAPYLNTAFFSPRLIASRVNLLTNFLNPNFYRKVPKEVRAMYFKDMAKFITFGASILGLAALGGNEVELDPRSADFLKIKNGNTRIDVLGGFQQYLRVLGQIVSGQKKAAGSDRIKELDGKGAFGEDRVDVGTRFLRGKLAPVPSSIVNLISGRDIIGEEATLGSEASRALFPLIKEDILRAVKDPSAKNLLLIAASAGGIGVQEFDKKKGGSGGGSGSSGEYKEREEKERKEPKERE